MLKSQKTLFKSAIAVAALAALAACGGGGGGGASGGGGGPVIPTPTNAPTNPPANATGQMMIGGAAMANAQVIFTCGCSPQAGTVTADANGNYSIPSSTTAIPSSPTPTYTPVPGRNYVVVGAAGGGSKAEAWTMLFYGSTPAHNVYLSSNNVSDEYTAAAALYVYYNSENASDQSFDRWNFNTIASWSTALRASRNAQEQKLIDDIKAAQSAGQTLFPSQNGSVPAWDVHGGPANPTIKADIIAVAGSGDAAVPTPCPTSGCTGAPTP